ncbi:hypothetical protein EVAR_77148_1 [Eumeta japonica]|uniref:Uncharacterized protein n=1 Tax=Eumeta variegata TaxID=151549 RepID=A0A4C1T4F6_EUMVA|nr:hypothetical protein EVAR_77148_1 [Eumeta japonica]
MKIKERNVISISHRFSNLRLRLKLVCNRMYRGWRLRGARGAERDRVRSVTRNEMGTDSSNAACVLHWAVRGVTLAWLLALTWFAVSFYDKVVVMHKDILKGALMKYLPTAFSTFNPPLLRALDFPIRKFEKRFPHWISTTRGLGPTAACGGPRPLPFLSKGGPAREPLAPRHGASPAHLRAPTPAPHAPPLVVCRPAEVGLSMESGVHAAVPLRVGKKMRKRRELDALVGGGGRGGRLLSASSDEGEPWARRSSRRRKHRPFVRLAAGLALCVCVVSAATVLWLFVDVRRQIVSLRQEMDRVTTFERETGEQGATCSHLADSWIPKKTGSKLRTNHNRDGSENRIESRERDQTKLRIEDVTGTGIRSSFVIRNKSET